MSEGLFAHGTLLKVSTKANAAVFNTIAEITNINPPAPTTDSIEVTSHDSVANGQPTKEFIPGSTDPGQITFDFNNVPTNSDHDDSDDALYGLLLSRSVRHWQVVFPTTPAVTVQCDGFLTGLTFAAPQEGKLGGSGTIKLTGGITFP